MTILPVTYTPCQGVIKSGELIATRMDALEKGAKVSYRIIDIAVILKKGITAPMTWLNSPFVLLSLKIKDLILIIESTRFFGVAQQSFFPNNQGKYFWQVNDWIRIAERVSIIFHTAIKLAFGLDKAGLIRLGSIVTYGIGYVSFFRWAVESTIFSFNFFGTWDAIKGVLSAHKEAGKAQAKIVEWQQHSDVTKEGADKIKQWTVIKNNALIERNKSLLKFAATSSKMVLIAFAVTLAVLNVFSLFGQLTILSLGIMSDSIGLARIFYDFFVIPEVANG